MEWGGSGSGSGGIGGWGVGGGEVGSVCVRVAGGVGLCGWVWREVEGEVDCFVVGVGVRVGVPGRGSGHCVGFGLCSARCGAVLGVLVGDRWI